MIVPTDILTVPLVKLLTTPTPVAVPEFNNVPETKLLTDVTVVTTPTPVVVPDDWIVPVRILTLPLVKLETVVTVVTA